MANTNNAEIPEAEQALVFSQSETDDLLQSVNDRIAQGTFEVNNHELLQRMVDSLADSRGMVRLGLVEALGKVGKPTTPFLVGGLSSNPNPVVRRSCAKALAIVADNNAVSSLIHSLLHDEDTVVRASSAGALARMGETAVTALLEIIGSPDSPATTKGQASWALSFIGTEAKELLYPAIHSDSPDVRVSVVAALGNQEEQLKGDREAVDLLIGAVKDNSPLVRAEAATALGRVAGADALEPLISCLEDVDDEVRKSVALRLMKIGEPRAIEFLQLALDREQSEPVGKVIQLAINQLNLF